MSPAGAVTAGHASLIRKIATPASTSRISTPAPVVLPANTRSPTRRLGRGGPGGALVMVTDRSVRSVRECVHGAGVSRGARRPGTSRGRPGPGGAGGSGGCRDRVDGRLRLVAQVCRDRCAAGGV